VLCGLVRCNRRAESIDESTGISLGSLGLKALVNLERPFRDIQLAGALGVRSSVLDCPLQLYFVSNVIIQFHA
jgi:hypothetical protein